MITRATIAMAAALSLVMPAVAIAARTDVIVLRNGDRFTGEVVQMRQGKLQVKTDDMGTLSIEWDKIASISTADQYDITRQDGSHLLGRFRPGTGLTTLQVLTQTGMVPATIADIVSFQRIKSGFLQRIDGSLDLGASYTQSSGVADLWFDTDATYRQPKYALSAAFSTNLTRQPDAPNTTRYSLNTTYTRYRGDRWLMSTLGLFESNRDLGFTFRGTAAESVGRFMVRNRHVELLLSGGLSAGGETPVDASPVTNVDAVVGTNFSAFTYDYPTTDIHFTALVFPSLDDPGRVRLNINSKLKREVFKDFFVSFTVYDAFDNRPKSGAAKQNDFGGSISFGWSF